MPPNMMTLIVWKRVMGIKVPITMHFPIMPESYMILKKYLTTVIPTRGGGWVDDFGAAPSPITISGTFGYKTKGFVGSGVYNGYGWAKYLEWLVDISHETDANDELPEVWMMSHLSQHYYEVELIDFNLAEKTTRNMIWTYELKMTTLRPITGEPLFDSVLSTVVEAAQNVGSAIKNIVKVSV